MIKLYNNSKIPDSVWIPIIKEAKQKAQVKGYIIVLITSGKRGGGLFNGSSSCKDRRFKNNYRWVSTDAGKVTITPLLTWYHDPIGAAQWTAKTILHELKHAFDFQNHNSLSSYIDNKKLQHDSRPCEIRANYFAKYEAKISENLIFDLAVEIERLQKALENKPIKLRSIKFIIKY